MTSKVIVLKADSDHAVGTVDDVFVAVWRHELPKGAHDEALAQLKKHAESAVDGVHLLSIVEATSSLPSTELRKHEIRVLEALGNNLKHVAVVIEGKGVIASVTRCLARSISRIGRPSLPTRIFAETEEAVHWLAAAAGRPEIAANWGQGVREICAAITKRNMG